MPGSPALFLLNARGDVSGWSRSAEQECGYDAAELRGLPIDRLLAAEAAAGGSMQWLRAATETGGCEIAGRLIRRDGSHRDAAVTIEPVRAGRSAAIAFAVTIGDPAAMQSAALDDSDSQFRLLVEGVVDYAIFMLDPAGNVARWNLGAERIKGYRADEIIGQHFSRFYTEEDRAKGEPQRVLAAAARDGRHETEGWRVRKRGERFWANAVLDAIRDGEGRLVGFAKITRDLSEQKAAEEALEETRAVLAQSQKMEAIGQLTGGVAHDFNNLLTVITNALDLLGGPSQDEARKRRLIDSAQRAAARGARLTQQLLAFARRQPLRPETHDINRLIGGFDAVLRRASSEPVQFELALAPGPLAARVDDAHFETALLNLVVNARDAMPAGGTVRITTGSETIDAARARMMSGIAPGEYVTVRVADTGLGMAPGVVERAFEPFFTTKEVGRGSGLGLSQVYGFVVQSGGHVAIDSTWGSGTAVTLYLPHAIVPEVEQGGPPGAGGTAIARVLVVEDDPQVLDVTVETLRQIGYEVLTAGDGPTAMGILHRETELDILFSDIVMPGGMNGVDLARAAQRLRPRLRILLASGYPAAGGGPRSAGEFAFLGKPYRGAELAEALRSLQTG